MELIRVLPGQYKTRLSANNKRHWEYYSLRIGICVLSEDGITIQIAILKNAHADECEIEKEF